MHVNFDPGWTWLATKIIISIRITLAETEEILDCQSTQDVGALLVALSTLLLTPTSLNRQDISRSSQKTNTQRDQPTLHPSTPDHSVSKYLQEILIYNAPVPMRPKLW